MVGPRIASHFDHIQLVLLQKCESNEQIQSKFHIPALFKWAEKSRVNYGDHLVLAVAGFQQSWDGCDFKALSIVLTIPHKGLGDCCSNCWIKGIQNLWMTRFVCKSNIFLLIIDDNRWGNLPVSCITRFKVTRSDKLYLKLRKHRNQPFWGNQMAIDL